jgi:molecular chaperone GrpE
MNDKEKTQPEATPLHFQVVDKRHFANLDEIPLDKSVADDKKRYPSFVEELIGKLELTEKSFQEKKELMQSEISRTRSRLEADFARKVELEKQKLMLPLLEVLDNLERAVDAASRGGDCSRLLEGVEMTVGLFRSKLQGLGVQPISLLNQPFDPEDSQAVAMVPVNDPELDGVVVDEVLKGYRMGEHLLRPAQVRVGHLVAGQEPAPADES